MCLFEHITQLVMTKIVATNSLASQPPNSDQLFGFLNYNIANFKHFNSMKPYILQHVSWYSLPYIYCIQEVWLQTKYVIRCAISYYNINMQTCIYKMRHFGIWRAVRIKLRHIEDYLFFYLTVTDKLEFIHHWQVCR